MNKKIKRQEIKEIKSAAIQLKNEFTLGHKIFFILILVLAIFIRIYPYWQSLMIEGKPFLKDPDVAFHLRRAEVCMRHYPWIPMYDSYEEYPAGSYYESPPLQTFILATVAFIAGGFRFHSSEFTAWILIFLPPLLAALAIWLIHTLSRFLFKSIWAAHVSALLAAMYPLSILKSNLGNIDHHITDYLGILLYFLMLVRAIERSKECTELKLLIKNAFLPGAMLAFCVYVWQASFLHGAVSALTFFIYYFLVRDRNNLLFAAIQFYWCALLLIPGAIYAVAGGINWNGLAYFSFAQAILIAALGSFFMGMYFVAQPDYSLLRNIFKAKMHWVMTGMIIMLLYLIRADIFQGIQIMVHNPNPWLKSVTESTPILYLYHEFSLEPLLSNLSYGSLIFPFILVVMLWIIYKNKGPFSWMLICAAGFIYGILTLLQARFGYPFTIPLALLEGYAIVVISTIFFRKIVGKPLVNQGIIPIVLSIILLIPCFSYYKVNEILPQDKYLKEAFDWLINNTPATLDFDTAQQKPEYSVLADWDYGTTIEYYAHRPTNIDARGPIHTDWSPVARYLLSSDEKGAEIFRGMLGFRYIMLTDWFTSLRIYPSWINANWDEYFSSIVSADGEEEIKPTDKLISTIGFQLTELSGNARIEHNKFTMPALQHYRLVWESSFLLHGGRPEPTSALKIFEWVNGAVLHWTGTPGSRITVSGMVITNIGRTFLYQNYVDISSSGNAVVYFPYPTERISDSAFVERYYLQSENKMIQLQNITNRMIVSGSDIRINK